MNQLFVMLILEKICNIYNFKSNSCCLFIKSCKILNFLKCFFFLKYLNIVRLHFLLVGFELFQDYFKYFSSEKNINLTSV